MPSALSALTMKVRSNGTMALSSAVSASNVSRATRSILFRTRKRGVRDSFSLSAIALVSCPMPRSASTTSATRSASSAPCQAAATMARSRRRLATRKMPGVSTSTTCAREGPSPVSGRSAIAIPITRMRVVCTLGETMLTLEPTRPFTSVDLPAFGAPTTATKPARVAGVLMPRSTFPAMSWRPAVRPRACCRPGRARDHAP